MNIEEKVDNIQSELLRIRDEVIMDLSSRVTELCRIHAPNKQTTFKNFCVKINNRSAYFSDFMDWVKNVDPDFQMKIMFKAIPFITYKDGKLDDVFTLDVPEITLEGWNEWWFNKTDIHPAIEAKYKALTTDVYHLAAQGKIDMSDYVIFLKILKNL